MSYKIIEGGTFEDDRGKLTFVNDFDMGKVQRFYHIHHFNQEVVRAWQGHRNENKWFLCTKGSFDIRLVQIDNWNNPSKNLVVHKIILKSEKSQILHIPGGYANGFCALENEASLMIFSDVKLNAHVKDDYRFNKDYWFKWKE